MEQVRSFIAIELPERAKQRLRNIESRLQAGSRVPAKWVYPDNIHLTLKFLGDIDTSVIPDINEVLASAVRGIHPFGLEIGGLGAFPNLKRVRVAWMGIKGDTGQLELLRKNIESGLEPLGFLPETRAFSPHLTLARVNDRASIEERSGLGKLLKETPSVEIGFQVTSVQLMRSQLTPTGAVYTKLGTAPLAN